MAKLSARGRVELARFEKRTPDSNDPNEAFVDNRFQLAAMSDGHILKKMTARWKDTGRIHDWGWKDLAKVKAGNDIIQVAEKYALARGYVRA